MQTNSGCIYHGTLTCLTCILYTCKLAVTGFDFLSGKRGQ